MGMKHGVTLSLILQGATAFRALVPPPSSLSVNQQRDASLCRSSVLFAAGQGFGKESQSKTYGFVAESIRNDVIDQEGAMRAFFSSREEWFPLFRTVAGHDLPADTASLMNSIDPSQVLEEIDFHETSSPWRQIEAIPKADDDRAVLSKFLDSMHQSLLDIPVNDVADPNDAEDDDEDDLHFLEEGRRMLAISRFHVLRDNQGGSVEAVDTLFSHVWSELMELSRANATHTGSIVLLPDYKLDNLRRFTDMSVKQPLKWLGRHTDFEVVALERDSPGIRLLYKLQDMPSGAYTEEEGFAAGASEGG